MFRVIMHHFHYILKRKLHKRNAWMIHTNRVCVEYSINIRVDRKRRML